MIECQLTLSHTFVEYLLHRRQFKDGLFTLVKMPFDPSKTLMQVCAIFRPQAMLKKINLAFNSVRNLRSPNEI